MSVEKNISLNKQTSRLLTLLEHVTIQLDELIEAFNTKNIKQADEINAKDLNVNIEFRYIIDKSTWILTQHVFLGEELRKLLSYNSIAKEFERLGDVIAGVAKYLAKTKMNVLAKDEFLNGLLEVKKRLKALKKVIKTPNEKSIIANLEHIRDQTNVYRDTKKFYIKRIAATSDLKLVESYLKEIRLLIRISRMSTYISNSYEYLLYTLTAKNYDYDYSHE